MESSYNNYALRNSKYLKTYSSKKHKLRSPSPEKDQKLTTKKAVELMLIRQLDSNVCRFCLSVTQFLYGTEYVLHVMGKNALYNVSVRDMVACFYPYQLKNDPNYPTKICDNCLNCVIASYLFTQRCDRAERAIRNCFEDMNEKIDKLDPIERKHTRGRQKLHPNYNTLHAEHKYVIDYAEPVMHLVSKNSQTIERNVDVVDPLQCPKCWQTLPNTESLVNHQTIHPKSMWYHCRVCGMSFEKKHRYQKHLKTHKKKIPNTIDGKIVFDCKICGDVNESYEKHLQHLDKHKFQTALDLVLQKRTNYLCAICLKKGELVSLDSMICLHGGCPALTGDKTLSTIIKFTLPGINIDQDLIGTSVCQQCLNDALASYVFVHKANYVRDRFSRCIGDMLDKIIDIKDPYGNIFIEMRQDDLLPLTNGNENNEFLLDEDEIFDEADLSVDVLEDEFRIKSDSDEENPVNSETKKTHNNVSDKNSKVTITLNGYQKSTSISNYHNKVKALNKLDSIDVCSEFLTFKKKAKKCFKEKYPCPMCGKKFISNYFLKSHILRHRNIKVECNICHKNFKSKFALLEHMKFTHTLKRIGCCSCNLCGRYFDSHEKLNTHTKIHMNIVCDLCEKGFTSQKHFNAHIRRHDMRFKTSSKKILSCSFCEKEFSCKKKLNIHVNKVHLQVKLYNCDMCDKQFYEESNLRKHKPVHSMSSKEICGICNKKFKCRKSLVVHVRKHMGIKPFSCYICKEKFYSESGLKVHKRNKHNNIHNCKLCKAVFLTWVELNKHVSLVHNLFSSVGNSNESNLSSNIAFF